MYTLKSGETLAVTSFVPGTSPVPDRVDAIRDLIIQPRRPWFSAGERAYVEGALESRFRDVARDCFCIAWLDGEPVGNVSVSTASAAPEIGLLSFVVTAPEQRGKGIAAILMREAVAHFTAAGGVCLHLGTDNPSAHRIYAACGFHDYNGHVMRYLSAEHNAQDFDSAYFADAGPAIVRPAHWGDQARIGMLYAAPHPWFIKDYAEHLYCSPSIAQARVGSILPSMMLDVTQRQGGLWALENAAHRLVGAATLTRPDLTAQRHAPILDFLVAPAYAHQAPDLARAVIAAVQDTDRVHVYLASCDRDKAAIVRAAGFSPEARLSRQFRAGDDFFDLEIWTKSLR